MVIQTSYEESSTALLGYSVIGTQCSWTQRTRRQGVQPEQTVDINQCPSSYVKMKQQTQYMTPSVL